MLTYKVKSGDNLSTIAYKYQTTTKIIMADNPIIKDANRIQIGWNLKIRTSVEYAKDQAAKAKEAASKSSAIKNSTSPPTANVISNSTGVVWNGLTILKGQIGMVTIKRTAYLYTFSANGSLKETRKVNKNQKFRCYGSTSKNGGLYELEGVYVKKADATYEVIPEKFKISNQVGTSVLTNNQAKVPDKNATKKPGDFVIPQLEQAGHQRTRIQVKKPDGKNLNMELRLLAFSTSHSNQYSANRTNAGWMINVGGKNLTSLTLNGFFLDTKTNKEADDFIKNYQAYFVPVSSEKYFSAMIATILHKGREYKGFITVLNISEQSDTPIDRKFSMQFLVLKEKGLSNTEIAASYPLVVNRNGQTEVEFLSSVRGMLTNPITGVYK